VLSELRIAGREVVDFAACGFTPGDDDPNLNPGIDRNARREG
jgi:hypothetical protein